MGSLLSRIRSWWENADRTQRVVTVFGLVLLTSLLLATFFVAGRPDMTRLYEGLTPEEQGMVMAELQTQGIPFRQDASGSIFVPTSRAPEIRANLAMNGKAPVGGGSGDNFAGIGLGNTPAVERERILAAKASDIEKTLAMLPFVKTARVHITPGDDSPFVSQRRSPAASVTIVSAPGATVSEKEGEAISRILVGEINGLDPKNVSVVVDGQIVFDGSAASGATAAADRRLQAQVAEAKRRELELQRTLDNAFGPGNTIVKVELEMDFDERTVNRLERNPSETPVEQEKNQETMAGGGAGMAGGIAGAVTNQPGAPAEPAGGTGGENYTGKRESVRFEVNETQSVSKEAGGDVTRMSVAVLVDSAKIEDPAPVEQFVRGTISVYQGPTYSVTVTPTEFNRAAEEEAKKAAASIGGQERLQQILSLLPIVALLIVGFMVVKALGKAIQPVEVPVVALPDGGSIPLGEFAQRMPAALAAVGESGDSVMAAQAVAAEISRSHAEQISIEAIPEQLNVPLEQIKKMAEERPDAVAMLVKSWLLEDRR